MASQGKEIWRACLNPQDATVFTHAIGIFTTPTHPPPHPLPIGSSSRTLDTLTDILGDFLSRIAKVMRTKADQMAEQGSVGFQVRNVVSTGVLQGKTITCKYMCGWEIRSILRVCGCTFHWNLVTELRLPD